MSTYLRLLRKEITGLIRTRRMLIALIVFGAFGALAPIMARLLPEMVAAVDPASGEVQQVTAREAVVQFVNLVSQLGSLALIFLTMGIVCSEKAEGTMAFLVVKPVPRSSIILAKLTGVVGMALVATVVAAAACVVVTPVVLGEALPLSFAGSAALVFLFAVSTVAIVVPASTIFRSQAAAGTVSTLIWMVLTALADIPQLGRLLPGRMTSHAVGVAVGAPMDWLPLVGTAAIVLAGALLAVLYFRRWETA